MLIETMSGMQNTVNGGAALPQSLSNSMVGNQAMSFANANPNAGKKAVHVKWAGKTIALGTFPQAEADEKCARAKALTRAWRSTMRPKPTREWVMLELERLQVRVVSGRLGRRGSTGDSPDEGSDEDDFDDDSKKHSEKKKKKDVKKESNTPPSADGPLKKIGAGDASNNLDWAQSGGPALISANKDDVGSGGVDESSIGSHRSLGGGSSSAAYEAAMSNHYNMGGQGRKGNQGKDKSKDMGLGNGMGNMGGLGQDQQSPMGLNAMNNGAGGQLSGGLGVGGLSGMGGANSLGGSGGQSGLLGAAGGSGGNILQLGLSVNPNQHYEMLKLHHMNLLNEIQETTLMMNLYQQQQLQQQQLQQQQSQGMEQSNFSSPPDSQLALQLAQQQQASGGGNPFLDSLYGMGSPGGVGGAQNLSGLSGQQRGLGLGVGGGGSANQMQALMRQQNLLSGGMIPDAPGSAIQSRLSLGNNSSILGQDQPLTLEEQEELCQARLQRLKQDIAERQRMADALEGGSGMGGKRNFGQDGGGYKRQRTAGEN